MSVKYALFNARLSRSSEIDTKMAHSRFCAGCPNRLNLSGSSMALCVDLGCSAEHFVLVLAGVRSERRYL